jgi:hypothetical protein
LTEPDDIPTRVSRLEQEMVEVRQKAADGHTLASGADHDVSVMQDRQRAHTRAISALRETQVEGFREMRDGFRQINANFRTVEGEFSKLNTGMAHITALLTNGLDEPDLE